MEVSVVLIDRAGAHASSLQLPEGATVEAALQALELRVNEQWGLARWGHRVRLDTVLVAGDRLEVASPLIIDPKVAREKRAAEQGDVRVITCGRHGGKHRYLKTPKA